ncbi:hypothetical protein AG1IA_00681 [Rhizoctonia solani AG-1 IA]|uniref:Uncharacterized protein n=1 Tax=Thanatephorus cucumeris (strain AG1-IA) TaxID=983506 RepID=L8X9E6_THACA|nr:hypothetical protein AG1IA_00681 [Rhizoctonia solani AG-1 IA]
MSLCQTNFAAFELGSQRKKFRRLRCDFNILALPYDRIVENVGHIARTGQITCRPFGRRLFGLRNPATQVSARLYPVKTLIWWQIFRPIMDTLNVQPPRRTRVLNYLPSCEFINPAVHLCHPGDAIFKQDNFPRASTRVIKGDCPGLEILVLGLC